MKKDSTKNMILTGMFAAILAVLSQLQIPMPSGVPITLQTFGTALGGFMLGMCGGVRMVLIYILVGVIGVPVFSGLTGGIGVVLGPKGGFIWGFVILAALCGYGGSKSKKIRITAVAAGVILCHLFGIFQFMMVMKIGFTKAALLVSLPFLPKDALSAAGAYLAAKKIKKRLGGIS